MTKIAHPRHKKQLEDPLLFWPFFTFLGLGIIYRGHKKWREFRQLFLFLKNTHTQIFSSKITLSREASYFKDESFIRSSVCAKTIRER